MVRQEVRELRATLELLEVQGAQERLAIPDLSETLALLGAPELLEARVQRAQLVLKVAPEVPELLGILGLKEERAPLGPPARRVHKARQDRPELSEVQVQWGIPE